MSRNGDRLFIDILFAIRSDDRCSDDLLAVFLAVSRFDNFLAYFGIDYSDMLRIIVADEGSGCGCIIIVPLPGRLFPVMSDALDFLGCLIIELGIVIGFILDDLYLSIIALGLELDLSQRGIVINGFNTGEAELDLSFFLINTE